VADKSAAAALARSRERRVTFMGWVREELSFRVRRCKR
jgi:hypothetical protein